jgi:hypothetical protein
MDTEQPKFMSLLQDETGSYSSGRALLWVWTAFTISLIATMYLRGDLKTIPMDILTVIFTFLQTVFLSIIGWVGGSRIAQHLFPQLGNTASALIGKLKGLTTSKTVASAADVEGEATTDVSEISEQQKG